MTAPNSEMKPRSPVGVVKPRAARASEAERRTEALDHGLTPRLVQARKGSILEIFGTQKVGLALNNNNKKKLSVSSQAFKPIRISGHKC
jgi:hypothetical protein